MKSHWLQNVIDSIADRGRELLGLDNSEHDTQNLHALCQQLLTGRGEASAIALSQEILRSYKQMSNEQKLAFFQKYFIRPFWTTLLWVLIPNFP